jgi:hypothetical protein
MGTNRHTIGTHPLQTRDELALSVGRGGRVGGPSLMGGGGAAGLAPADMAEEEVAR